MQYKSPIIIQWEVTYDCNQNCIHCYNYWQQNTIKKKLSFSTGRADEIVDDILQAGVFAVVITGGEPLLLADKLYPYIEKLTKNKIDVVINSNLTTMTDEIAAQLIKREVRHVLTSLPAPDDDLDTLITSIPGGLAKRIRGIKIALHHGLTITPNMVVSKINIDKIYDTAQLAQGLGLTKFSINNALASDNNFDTYLLSPSELSCLPYELKKIKDALHMSVTSVEANRFCINDDIKLLKEVGMLRTCGAGKTFCVISPDGSIRDCIASDKNYIGTISEVWPQFALSIKESLPTECVDCRFVRVCAGGCRIELEKKKMKSELCTSSHNYVKKNRWNNTESVAIQKRKFSNYDNFRFDESIRHRDEANGGMLYRNIESHLYVDAKSYSFFNQNQHTKFNLKTFCDFSGFSHLDAELVLSVLLNNKMIAIAS